MFSSCGVGAVRGLDVPVTYIALPQAAESSGAHCAPLLLLLRKRSADGCLSKIEGGEERVAL